MPLLVGTSGWQYRTWKEAFYPNGLPQRSWLEHYSALFATVEVNNAFYRLPESSVFAAWGRRTPEDFVVAVKASRYLTHVKRLRDPAEPVARFVERAAHLGAKRGPVLLQLPPNLARDLPALDETLGRFPGGWRVAVEPRHESWFVPETEAVLRAHGAALCMADSPRRRPPCWPTAGWGYLRMHEGRASPHPCYGRRALDTWARRLADLYGPHADIYVYFNNDHLGCAVRDASTFARLAQAAGLAPTRVPSPDEVRVKA